MDKNWFESSNSRIDKIRPVGIVHTVNQRIPESRFAAFTTEGSVSIQQLTPLPRARIVCGKIIFINIPQIILGRGSQSNQWGVKIIENITVFVINGPVRFITDYEIKMTT